MTLKDKLNFVIPLLSVILLTLSYFQFVEGYGFNKKINKTDQTDVRLMQELLNIEGKSRLSSIDKNMKILNNLLGVLFDKFSISDTDKGNFSAGIDRIGEYRDVEIAVKGDFWQQIYFFQQIKRNMRDFVVLNALSGNNTQALFKTRIYGRTN